MRENENFFQFNSPSMCSFPKKINSDFYYLFPLATRQHMLMYFRVKCSRNSEDFILRYKASS